MLKKKSKIVLYISPLIVGVVLLLMIFEIKIDHGITTLFEVNPLQKWILSKGSEGQIESSILDFQSATSNNFAVVQFERGESMNFKLEQSVIAKSSITKGDTVGKIFSSQLLERLTQLEGYSLIAKSNLAAKSTGEKSAIIDEARSRIKFTEARIQEKKLLFARTEELFKKEYISKEDYEASLWELKQLEIENDINKAQLNALMTGSKSEDLKVLQSTIDSYLNEIQLLKKRLKDFVITAPISGEIIKEFSGDTILIVNNTSQVILTAPIRYEHIKYLTEGKPVTLELKYSSEEIKGTLVSISKEVKNLNGVQILYARILIDSSALTLVSGLVIPGEIALPRVTIKEYLFSLLKY
jgi:hypothetical protein